MPWQTVRLSLALTLALGLALTVQTSILHSGEGQDTALSLRLERFRSVEAVMELIEREYIAPIDRQRLWDGAYHGMAQMLDSHSYYSDQRSQVLYLPGVDNTDPGFGFDWYHDSLAGGMVVRRVSPGSSAQQAGMVAGDLLVQIADMPLLGVSPVIAAERLTNASNETSLRVRHADHSIELLHLVRGLHGQQSISKSVMLDSLPGLGLVHITRFLGVSEEQSADPLAPPQSAQTITGRAFRRAMEELREQGLRGLIIDLRGNGGGSIPAAVEIADCFLSGNEQRPTVISRQRGRTPARHQDWYARADNTLTNWPVVVLIDGSTSSAAEVLASALQDNRRAVIIGSASMGKDTVQQTFHLEGGGALRLTVARYLTPQGRSLHGVGVEPDIVVPMGSLQRYQVARKQWLSAKGEAVPEALREASDSQMQRAIDVLTALLVSPR